MALSKEELLEQKQTAKTVLETSYEMYEKSIADMLKRRKTAKDKDGNLIYSEKDTKKALQLMETMQKDVIDRYIELGGTEEELKSNVASKNGKKKGIDRKALEDIMKKETAKEEMTQYVEQMKNVGNEDVTKYNVPDFDEYEEKTEKKGKKTKQIDIDVVETKEKSVFVDTNINVTNKVQWDSVPLPSKGQCYKHKLDKVPVGYLTAYDENLIVSPNLYKDGTFIDELLKTKVMNSNIDVEDLLPGDRDAIILWLRGTSYGTDFPVTATDNETGKQFDTTVDLTEIKTKPFKLIGDENGYFDFELPLSKDKVKFRFLTYKNLKTLEKIEAEELDEIKKRKLTNLISELSDIIDGDEDCDRLLKKKLTEGISRFEEYRDGIIGDEKAYSHAITNKLAMSIVSINDITDRRYINEYVTYMNVKDSSALRKYITENEPGLDFNITVERPESLGGGSVNMFLTLDQFIFLNIA